jgi:MEMO1 family protein
MVENGQPRMTMEDRALPEHPVRSSPIAGTWYPGHPDTLERMVRELLEAVEPADVEGELLALLAPHAGLRYSGAVAAAGYRLLEQRRFEAAVLLGPSHHVYFQGASIYDRGAFETPLGRMEIDEDLARSIRERSRSIRVFREAHDREHSLEMQLPFLQVLHPGMKIVPIIMGDQRRPSVDLVADAVSEVLSRAERSVLMIASSDLSHYKSAEVAARMDEKVARCVERFSPDELMTLLEHHHEHACGGGPLVAVMRAARDLGGETARVLRYGDSGDVSGDKAEVVGYLSAAFSRPERRVAG